MSKIYNDLVYMHDQLPCDLSQIITNLKNHPNLSELDLSNNKLGGPGDKNLNFTNTIIAFAKQIPRTISINMSNIYIIYIYDF